MKILILSHKPVFPSVDGGSVAVKKLYYDLKTKYKSMILICFNSNKKRNKKSKNHKNQNYLT